MRFSFDSLACNTQGHHTKTTIYHWYSRNKYGQIGTAW